MKRILQILAYLFVSFASTFAQETTKYIRLNQIGFLPFAQKQAAIIDVTATTFDIADTLGNVVFTNNLSNAMNWASSGESVKIADFSILTVPGIYTLNVPGFGNSVRFEISDSAFNDVNNAIIKAFYFNRASTPLLSEFAGKYARPEGHADTVVIVLPSAAGPTRIAGDTIRAPKGWYDAGDYNKYIVNSGITTGTLLQAYETYPEHFDTLTWNIPESGNAIPDLLDEIKWNLDWMLTMQDSSDGGVYNKTTEASFSAMVMPQYVTAKRYVVAKGTAATLDFAAVMAMAARIYKPFYPNFADSCLAAAEYAWNWAIAHPTVTFTNPAASGIYPAVTTGGYGDNDFSDEKIWAATELFISTNNESKYAASINITGIFDIPMWRTVGTLCLYSLYNHKDSVGYRIDTTTVKTKILSKASSMQQYQIYGNPYKVPVTNFSWGSNGGVANQAIMLLFAYRITKDLSYLNAAIASYDYILGRNATEYSFVTEFGEKCSKNIHHRVSESDAVPGSVPGFLAGGPNGGTKSDCGTYSSYAAKAYKDETCSFTTNEIAINWQAPLVFTSNAIVAEYNNWQQELPDSFAIVSTSKITCERTQETANFSVLANVTYTIETTDTWYSLTPDSTDLSSIITINILEFNDGDSIRHGSFNVLIDSMIVATIEIDQIGRLSAFRIEAENYNTGFGISTETTTDIGGGLNVGWIEDGDYATYTIDITKSGSYEIAYRYAALIKSGQLYMEYQDSAYSLIFPTPTGGWQVWQTMKDTAYFTEGIYEVTLQFPNGGFNLNYLDFTFINEENVARVHTPVLPIDPSKIISPTISSIVIPNPINNNNLVVYGLSKDISYTCNLYSMNGVLVNSETISTNANSISIASGTYFCTILSNNTKDNFIIIVK